MKPLVHVPQAVFFSGYQNLKLIGQGASAKVYLALQTSTGQHVAIKHLQCHRAKNEQPFIESRRQRFLRETDMCAQLNNPYIVRLIDQGFCTDQSPYAVFEYIPGETLTHYLRQQGPLNGEQTKHLMLQVLDALACAHQHGIIHRDLKPQNLMVSKTGTEACIKILDFGISTWQNTHSASHQKLTLTQETLGTPHYSAPEQLRNKTLGTYSDLYAWGLIVVECLIGKPIINAASVADSIRQQLDPAPLALPPFIAQHPIANLLRRVLAKNPNQRLHCARRAYAELMDIPMHTLLAKTPLSSHHSIIGNTTQMVKPHDLALSENRFITVLSCRMTLQAYNNTPINEEQIDQALASKVQACYELLSHYGGRPSGHIGNTLLTFFGDEQPLDNCAEIAAKTAILIRQHTVKWDRELQKNGLSITIEQSIHCGKALANTAFNSANQVSKITLDLLNTAKKNEILVSSNIHNKLAKLMYFSHNNKNNSQANDTYCLLSEHKQSPTPNLKHTKIEGRDKELSQLEKVFSKAKEYNQAIRVYGEAGIGKSALISQALERFTPSTLKVTHWHGHKSQQQSALHAILNDICERFSLEKNQPLSLKMEILKQELLDHDIFSTHHFVVMAHWLNISSQAIMAESHLYSPEKQQELLFETLCKFTFNRNQAQPCIVVIEDTHWLDAISLQFIQYMVRQTTKQRLLLLMTCRTQSINDDPIDFHLDNIDVQNFHLQPLEEDAIKVLINKHLHKEKNNQQQAHNIAQRSSGIPLFIKELIQLANNDIDTYKNIPSSLDDILASRIQQAGTAKPLLYCLAIFAQDINEKQLAVLMKTDRENIRCLLQHLLSIGLIRQKAPAPDSELTHYSIQHALYQEAVYQQINTQDKKQYHLMIAQYLVDTTKLCQSANIAHHYAAANTYDNAVEQGLIAVQYLLSIAASTQALAEIQSILCWCKLLPPAKSHRAQLRALQFKLHGMTNQLGWAHPEVSQSVKQLQDIIPQHIAPFSQHIDSVCYWTLATYYHVASQRTDAQKVAQHLVETSHRVVDETLMLLGYGLKGVTHWIDGQYNQAAIALKLTLTETNDTADKHIAAQYGLDVKVWAGAALANVYWFQGKTTNAFEQARQAVNRATAINHLPSLGIALMYQTFLFQHEQNHEKTKDCASKLLSLADTYGLPAVEGYATALLGWSNHDALMIEKTLQQLQSLGCLLGSSYLYSLLAESVQQQGDIEAAIAWINEGLQAAQTINEPYFLAPLYQQKALYLKQLSINTYHRAIEQCLQHSQQLCRTQKIRKDCYLPLQKDTILSAWYEKVTDQYQPIQPHSTTHPSTQQCNEDYA